MRIGSTNVSSHAAGMSALWHDADYLPEKHIHTPTVEKGLSEMPLPSEQHQLPPGVADPFARLDQVYDLAGQQMERGLEGQAFLHGRNTASAAAAASEAGDEVTRTMARAQEASRPDQPRAVSDARATSQQLEARAQAGAAAPKVSNATQPSDAKRKSEQAERALQMAEGLGVSVAAMAVGQALDPSGAMGASAASATGVVKAVSTAKTAVGLASAMSQDEGPGLRRGIGARGHQPSLDPGDASHQPSLDPGHDD